MEQIVLNWLYVPVQSAVSQYGVLYYIIDLVAMYFHFGAAAVSKPSRMLEHFPLWHANAPG